MDFFTIQYTTFDIVILTLETTINRKVWFSKMPDCYISLPYTTNHLKLIFTTLHIVASTYY